MSDFRFTASQKQAIRRLQGRLFLAAGAGSGKTGVVTHRFVYAVATGFATVDEILTITFTRKAAAEMMERIRKDLRQPWLVDAEPDDDEWRRMAAAYRDIERAQISTIDSFCASVLRANALAAGLDPEFSAADEAQARIISEEVFEGCLIDFVRQNGEPAVDLIRQYDGNLEGELYSAITSIYAQLRARGAGPVLPYPRNRLAESEAGLRAAIANVVKEQKSLAKEPNKTQAKALEQVVSLQAALDSLNKDAVYTTALDARAAGASRLGALRDACEAFNTAREFLIQEIRSRKATGTLRLFQDLLGRFAAAYAEQKRRLGLLDFSDLTIKTRNLLRDNHTVCEKVAVRYKLVMVDEFQDTNPLQKEIIELIAGENLLMVGDQNQSIYGFRDAVVELFQTEDDLAAANGYRIELADNFRSQPEILRFVDYIFNREEMLGKRYFSLNAAAGRDPVPEDQRIEIILVDEGRKSKKEDLKKVDRATARAAEAQLIAERLSQLYDSGRYTPGDTAVLVREAAHAESIRAALTGAGINNCLAAGRSYFQKLELGDVISIFKLIVNPLDDIAMFGALRSPLVGLSDDALYWLRQTALDESGRAQPLWRTISVLPELSHLNPRDLAVVQAFITAFKDLRYTAKREPLSITTRRILDLNDYAAVITGGPDGKQKLANLLMLLDLAADFEAAWGNDTAEFAEFLEKQKQIKAKQADAPTEEEGVDAVRIMTMHTAKGLEFPLVVLPHLSWEAHKDSDIIKIDREGLRAGIQYKADDGFAGPAFDFGALKEEEAARGKEEEYRLGYVSMTRAKRHLILSGFAPIDIKPKRDNKVDPPLNWLRDYLDLSREGNEQLENMDQLTDINGVNVGLQICSDPEIEAERFTRARAYRSASEAPRALKKNLEPLPAASYIPPQISPTSLDLINICPRRYYFERVLRVREIIGDENRQSTTATGGGINRTEMGTLVHALLERATPPIGDPAALSGETIAAVAAQVIPGATLTEANRKKTVALYANIVQLQVSHDINEAAAADRLSRELSFSTMVGAAILKGQMDVFIKKENGSLVVDYKTGDYRADYPDEKTAAAHQYQMSAYALAASRIHPGPVEVVIALLDDPVREIRLHYNETHLAGLEAELKVQLDSLADGRFAPLPEFNTAVCQYCDGNRGSEPLCPTAGSAR